mmetsp:Transcript_8260/g.14954  ORF Transcript_8260/g.14954 Transcript_8260/m.14954 type:complete len:176 (-) Transcript_8260:559-1086(-)
MKSETIEVFIHNASRLCVVLNFIGSIFTFAGLAVISHFHTTTELHDFLFTVTKVFLAIDFISAFILCTQEYLNHETSNSIAFEASLISLSFGLIGGVYLTPHQRIRHRIEYFFISASFGALHTILSLVSFWNISVHDDSTKSSTQSNHAQFRHTRDTLNGFEFLEYKMQELELRD